MECPFCKSPVQVNADLPQATCNFCGHIFSTAPDPEPAPIPEPARMNENTGSVGRLQHCTKCGAFVPASRFCQECGASMFSAKTPQEGKKRTKEKKPRNPSFACGLIAFILALVFTVLEMDAKIPIVFLIPIILGMIALFRRERFRGFGIVAIGLPVFALIVAFNNYYETYATPTTTNTTTSSTASSVRATQEAPKQENVTYKTYTVAGVNYSIPSIIREGESKEKSTTRFIPESERYGLLFADAQYASSREITDSDLSDFLYEISSDLLDDMDDIYEYRVTIAGNSGHAMSLRGDFMGQEAVCKLYAYNNKKTREIGFLVFVVDEKYEEYYLPYFEKMMEGATSAGGTRTASSSGSSGSTTGGRVDPQLKAFLDSYEDFIDEYLDFLKDYMAHPENVSGMLTRYTQIMQEYADFEEKLGEYDLDDMSSADLAYYTEVTARVYVKLMSLY